MYYKNYDSAKTRTSDLTPVSQRACYPNNPPGGGAFNASSALTPPFAKFANSVRRLQQDKRGRFPNLLVILAQSRSDEARIYHMAARPYEVYEIHITQTTRQMNCSLLSWAQFVPDEFFALFNALQKGYIGITSKGKDAT
jgi:hypothetical protein